MRILNWVKREILHVLPVFIFFFVAFFLINLNEKFLFRRAGLTPFTFVEVILAAAVVAKVFLVIDHLRWIDLFANKPLVYNVLWKTFCYWLIVITVRLAVHLMPYLFNGEGFSNDLIAFVDRFNWRLFISVQIYYLMLLLLFTVFREIAHAIGPDKMRKLFFGR